MEFGRDTVSLTSIASVLNSLVPGTLNETMNKVGTGSFLMELALGEINLRNLNNISSSNLGNRKK